MTNDTTPANGQANDDEDEDEAECEAPRADEYGDDRIAEERRHFGEACKRMMALLSVNRLPASFDDAKAWVRIWGESGGEFDVTEDAAPWIDAGWLDPELVSDAVMVGLDAGAATAAVTAAGFTVEQALSGDVPDLFDLLDAAARPQSVDAERGAS